MDFIVCDKIYASMHLQSPLTKLLQDILVRIQIFRFLVLSKNIHQERL
nr:MAG TPA: hypothetical protein [Caudoviricetes sp.]